MSVFRVKNIPEEIAGVRIIKSTRAKRMNLRVDTKTGDVVLTFPPRGSIKGAETFIRENHRWILKQRCRQQNHPAIIEGMSLCVLDKKYILRHRPGRGLACFKGNDIIVRGAPEHLPRRLKDFLKKQATETLTILVHEKTLFLDLVPGPVQVIDPKTRWGSCTPEGKIMLSWRLILAPGFVMDYVVAHEVAHRKYLNHGPRFWSLCRTLTDRTEDARQWLRQHGDKIMRMRFSS